MNTVQLTRSDMEPGSLVVGGDVDFMVFSRGALFVVNDGALVFSIAADGTVTQGEHTRGDLERIKAASNYREDGE